MALAIFGSLRLVLAFGLALAGLEAREALRGFVGTFTGVTASPSPLRCMCMWVSGTRSPSYQPRSVEPGR